MEKAYKLEFAGEQTGSLYVSCCGLSRTEPMHSFGPALKPQNSLSNSPCPALLIVLLNIAVYIRKQLFPSILVLHIV